MAGISYKPGLAGLGLVSAVVGVKEVVVGVGVGMVVGVRVAVVAPVMAVSCLFTRSTRRPSCSLNGLSQKMLAR